jgi:hypothetical protein
MLPALEARCAGSVKMRTVSEFHCHTCGKLHAELPRSFQTEYPAPYWDVPEAERAKRCDFSPEIGSIDGEHFFVRGNIEIPVRDGSEPLTWGVWASLSEANFRRTLELWETEGRESEPPYFGWLCTQLPCYPDTLLLKTHVHTREVGLRPLIELEPTDHPLAVEQREGITPERLHAVAAEVMGR